MIHREFYRELLGSSSAAWGSEQVLFSRNILAAFCLPASLHKDIVIASIVWAILKCKYFTCLCAGRSSLHWLPTKIS